MKSDFIPRRDGDLDSFEENFINKIDTHAPVLQIDPSEIAGTKNTIQLHREAFSSMNAKKTDSMSATEHNRLNKENALNELRRIAKKIKTSKLYTRAIGDDLGIIGSDAFVPAQNELKPVLKAAFNGQNIIIKFRKNGCDGVRIYSRISGESNFAPLAIETGTLYTDPRSKAELHKPESREFYAIYLVNYNEIGQQSDVAKIVVP